MAETLLRCGGSSRSRRPAAERQQALALLGGLHELRIVAVHLAGAEHRALAGEARAGQVVAVPAHAGRELGDRLLEPRAVREADLPALAQVEPALLGGGLELGVVLELRPAASAGSASAAAEQEPSCGTRPAGTRGTARAARAGVPVAAGRAGGRGRGAARGPRALGGVAGGGVRGGGAPGAVAPGAGGGGGPAAGPPAPAGLRLSETARCAARVAAAPAARL